MNVRVAGAWDSKLTTVRGKDRKGCEPLCQQAVSDLLTDCFHRDKVSQADEIFIFDVYTSGSTAIPLISSAGRMNSRPSVAKTLSWFD